MRISLPSSRRCAVRVRAFLLAGTFTVSLLLAPAALADSTQSSNWAGYAAHASHVSYSYVFGAWRQPSVSCTAGTPTYSSVWVGLGGYNINSNALEQIGSEVDCSATGRVVSTVWYELVPAPSRAIRMQVGPGDELTASVSAVGHRVRLQLADLTRKTSFSRTTRVSQIDLSSADWIVEAPSECTSSTSCQELALADFGSTGFSRASVQTSTGHKGRIADRHWTTTKIVLATGSRQFIGGPPSPGVTAAPSTLSAGGSAFTVTYQASSAPGQPTPSMRRAMVAGVRLLRKT